VEDDTESDDSTAVDEEDDDDDSVIIEYEREEGDGQVFLSVCGRRLSCFRVNKRVRDGQNCKGCDNCTDINCDI
jgi:hypothetical protein